MNRLKIAGAAICTLWALGACGSCGAPSGAASSGPTADQLASAAVKGTWSLTVTVAGYTGPPPPASNRFQAGHVATDKVTFVSQCVTGGTCSLQLWGPAGPDPSQATYYQFYSNSSSLEGPPVSTPMSESGHTYSGTIPIAGFGGFSCRPSQTVPRPVQSLSLTVDGAEHDASVWRATSMSGEEALISGWGCGANGFTGWTVERLQISGKASP